MKEEKRRGPYQGIFRPQNPQKYKGDHKAIIYRSSWELQLMVYLDRHDEIISWGSEEVIVPYVSPVDGRIHRYYVDFIVTKINNNGKKETMLIEVKPLKETKPPEKKSKVTKKYLTEVVKWGINESKWNAAKRFCEDRGWTFHIFTEKELGIK